MSKYIPLTQGKEAIVDDEDYLWLMQWKWTYTHPGKGNTGYAYRHDYSKYPIIKNIRMHRLIMEAPPNLEVDHLNHDGLDNRKKNLRLVNHSLNNRNKKNKYSGIDYRPSKKKWRLRILGKGFGHFNSKQEAFLMKLALIKKNPQWGIYV